MVTDHDQPGEHPLGTPLVMRLEQDGTGSASFNWAQVLDALTSGLQQHVNVALGRGTHVLGLRFVDADGRDVNGPVPSGLVLVGFTTPPGEPHA